MTFWLYTVSSSQLITWALWLCDVFMFYFAISFWWHSALEEANMCNWQSVIPHVAKSNVIVGSNLLLSSWTCFLLSAKKSELGTLNTTLIPQPGNTTPIHQPGTVCRQHSCPVRCGFLNLQFSGKAMVHQRTWDLLSWRCLLQSS